MKFSKILSTAACTLIAVASLAQTAAEISTAKSIAKSYGYTDKDIDAVLNNTGGNNQSGTAGTQETSVSTPTDSTSGNEPVTETEVYEVTPAVPVESTEDDIYGHNYFKSEGLSLIPTYNAPAPASYILGPGDEVIVDIWGSTVSHIVATIANDGSIVISDLGPVYLAGMTIRSAEASLKAQLSRIYSGLSDDKGDTYLRMSIGKIKGVVINVSGEIGAPGAYTIPSLSSIPSVIYMAGGITEHGTVRNISLYRHGKKVATFDLYDYIFNGQFNEDLRLQDGDIINIPAYSNVVKISGAVSRPQRYEMKDGESAEDLLRYALGFTTRAQRDAINVTRFTPEGGMTYDIAGSSFAGFRLQDGDEVKVREFTNLYSNKVTITGPVKFPGVYAIDGGIKDVAGLINAAGGLKESAYPERGYVKRLDENSRSRIITFNLKNVLNGTENVSLFREDSVKVFSKDQFIVNQTITLEGHFKTPGTFDYHEGMTIADAILIGDGVKDDVYGNRGQISRINDEGMCEIVSFNLADVLEGKTNFELKRDDLIRIYGKRDLVEDATISVNGEVNKPDSFTYHEGFTLGDALLLANGFKNGADLANIQVASRGGRERGTVSSYNLADDPSAVDTPLKPYDVISVRRLTYFRPQTTVTVNGEVYAPGTYVVDKAEVRISDILSRVGGFTDEAYLHGASLSRQMTDEETERLRTALEIAQENSDEVVNIDSTITADRTYLIGIDLEKALDKPGSSEDVILREGDVINIPQMNNTVKISGAVFHPNTVAFVKGASWRSYIRQAGGFAANARKGKVYAVYMNGKIATGLGIVPEPGMELYVPQHNESDLKKMSPAEWAAMASSTTSLTTLILTLLRFFA